MLSVAVSPRPAVGRTAYLFFLLFLRSFGPFWGRGLPDTAVLRFIQTLNPLAGQNFIQNTQRGEVVLSVSSPWQQAPEDRRYWSSDQQTWLCLAASSAVQRLRFTRIIFIYLLTPQSRVLLEKLTGFQLVKKFPTFYGTRRFVTAFKSARHLSLSWASSIQSIPPSHFPKIHLNIILPSTPGSSKWSFSVRFPAPKPCIHVFWPQYMLHAPPISFSIWSHEQYWVRSTDH